MERFQPVGHVIGRLCLALGLAMLIPAAIDYYDGHEAWLAFVVSATLTATAGGAFALLLASAPGRGRGLDRRQAVLLTVLVWVVLPIFGALPFIFGLPGMNYTDAFFEAMSGLTTTGATVLSGLEDMDRGMLLWRAMLQWFGGVGIVVVAMVFLPVLKIGGMQFFRTESFDLIGDLLPRAAEAAGQLFGIYFALSLACMIGYSAAGMNGFDAICHAMTTVSTGGMANYDASFAAFDPLAQYVAVLFMTLAALPFLRLMQLSRGQPLPLLRDPQIRGFVTIVSVVATLMVAWRLWRGEDDLEPLLRSALFNVTAILTGTGYASSDFNGWGGFPVALFFLLALIGGCAGSTSCSAKIFRYQILFAALKVQLARIHSPHGVFALRYAGRTVDGEVLSSVMGYFFVFSGSLALWAVLLSLTG
ncbi:MAG: TrkH family potassium uptake protein, partial [Pseudomonadota bacterium]